MVTAGEPGTQTGGRDRPDHLDAVRWTARWLESVAVETPHGLAWPEVPGDDRPPRAGLGWGSAGVVLFYAEAYRTLGDPAFRHLALEGTRWLTSRLERIRPLGLYTGLAGVGFVLDVVAGLTDDRETADGAARVVDLLLTRPDEGDPWDGLTDVFWGTAGIGLFLLGPAGAKEGLARAEAAGRWLLEVAEPVGGGGLRWGVGEAYRAIDPRVTDRRFPNFAHGTAGIAFFLARLARRTGDPRFLDAALAGTRWVFSCVSTSGGGASAYHHEPDGTGLRTLGFCHGPPGLALLFRELGIATGDPAWTEWVDRCATTLRTSGIPARLTPGFWDNVGRCCGSAGVAEFFLDLDRDPSRDDPGDLLFARLLLDDLLDRATFDGTGMPWSNIEFRRDPPGLPPATSYLQGAAGIASTLLRLDRHLRGDLWTVPWVHITRPDTDD